MKKSSTKISRKDGVSIIPIVSLLAIAGLTWKPLAIRYGKWLAAGESEATGDMSVLLSGNNTRVRTLIELYDKDRVQGIYYAAGADEKREHLEGYRQIFAEYNLPASDLYCGDLVESTFDEAQAFKRKLAEIDRPVDKIVLVSDRYHLRRGVWSFRRVLGDEIEVSAYPTPSSAEIADSHWWKHEASRDYVISETKKIGFYWFYYGLLGKDNLITKDDVARITEGKISKSVEQACNVVLPQLSQK